MEMMLGTTHPFWCLAFASHLVELPHPDFRPWIHDSTFGPAFALNPVLQTPDGGPWCCLALRTAQASCICAGLIPELSWELEKLPYCWTGYFLGKTLRGAWKASMNPLNSPWYVFTVGEIL